MWTSIHGIYLSKEFLMDLYRQPPRRPSNIKISGVIGLARMADKARANASNSIGEYLFGYDSPLDLQVLNFIGLTPEEFSSLAYEMNDDDLFTYIRSRNTFDRAELKTFNTICLKNGFQNRKKNRIPSQEVRNCETDHIDMMTTVQSIESDDLGSFSSLDLTIEPPRTPYDRSIIGVFGAARMSDKARAYNSNCLGEYRYGLESGLDTAILSFLELDAAEFVNASMKNPNDIELSEWLGKHVKQNDCAKLSFNAQRAYFGFFAEEREAFLARRLEVGCDGSVADTFFDLMDFDDQKSFNIVDLRRRPPRSVYDTSIDGIAGLARLIDKGIANKYNMLGIYKFGDRSNLDKLVLEFLNLSEVQIINAIKSCSTEIDIVNCLREIRLEKNRDEIFKFNDYFWRYEPADPDERSVIRSTCEDLDPRRKYICCLAASVELKDEIHFSRLKTRI